MESLESLEENRNASLNQASSEQRGSKLRRIGVVAFGIFCFFFFLMMKLPEARIQNLVIAHLRIMAQDQGFLFSAEKVRLGIFLGPSLKFYNIELKSIDDETQTLKIPYLKVSPKIFSLLSSTKKVAIVAEMMGGDLSGAVGAGATGMYADLDLDGINPGVSSLLEHYVPVHLGAKLNGRLKLDFDMNHVPDSAGLIKLKIDKLAIPSQAVYGFNLPKLAISTSNINIAIEHGQIIIKSFDLGKDIKTDDLVAHITGNGQLDRELGRSRINAKAVFDISQRVKQSFPLLDALLGSAKTPDGKYSYTLTGPLMSLEPHPGG